VGLRRRGFVPDPTSETYRGPSPGSEPETKALDAFEKRIGFATASTTTPPPNCSSTESAGRWRPDPGRRALQGARRHPENPAIPGYHPQVSSELYTTNGEADGHASNVNGMSMFTPEMSTCQTASNIDPNDAWNAADCQSSSTSRTTRS
jgi:hypothetical protein